MIYKRKELIIFELLRRLNKKDISDTNTLEKEIVEELNTFKIKLKDAIYIGEIINAVIKIYFSKVKFCAYEGFSNALDPVSITNDELSPDVESVDFMYQFKFYLDFIETFNSLFNNVSGVHRFDVTVNPVLDSEDILYFSINESPENIIFFNSKEELDLFLKLQE